MENIPRLSRIERKVIWTSAGIFLATLLFLFFLGLFLPIEINHPFLPGFYYISEVIAAIAAGVLASTICGFFKIEFERTIGKSGRFFVQASGGFAVFLTVMWMGPKQQMTDISDLIFSNLIRECEQAVTNSQVNLNAKSLCNEVAKKYPNRPEPWRYLAMWHHRNASGLNDFSKAANFYKKSLELYGIVDRNFNYLENAHNKLNRRQEIRVSEVLIKYGGANADYELYRFSKATNQEKAEHQLQKGLLKSEKAPKLALQLANKETDAYLIGAAYDLLGKIELYRYFLFLPNDSKLINSVKYYDKALINNTYFSIYLTYHKLFAVSILNSAKTIGRNEKNEEENLLSNLVAAWHKDMVHPNNIGTMAATQLFFREMFGGSRNELYTVTLPFGSKKFGGDAFVKMLSRNETLTDQLRKLL